MDVPDERLALSRAVARHILDKGLVLGLSDVLRIYAFDRFSERVIVGTTSEHRLSIDYDLASGPRSTSDE